MRAGTTCKNAACKAVSTWQGPILTQPVPCGQEHPRPRFRAGGRWQCPSPLYSHPALGVATSVTSQPLSCKRPPDWWYICVSLLLVACSEIQHMLWIGHVGKMHKEQFPPALN